MWPLVILGMFGIGAIVYARKQTAANAQAAGGGTVAPSVLPNLPNVPNAPGTPGTVVPITPPAASAAPAASTAVVTTNCAPGVGSAYGPGDLIIRSGPSDSAPQIGGADKGGTVTVLNWAAGPNYAQISWAGGRLAAVPSGYAHVAYLKKTS